MIVHVTIRQLGGGGLKIRISESTEKFETTIRIYQSQILFDLLV